MHFQLFQALIDFSHKRLQWSCVRWRTQRQSFILPRQSSNAHIAREVQYNVVRDVEAEVLPVPRTIHCQNFRLDMIKRLLTPDTAARGHLFCSSSSFKSCKSRAEEFKTQSVPDTAAREHLFSSSSSSRKSCKSRAEAFKTHSVLLPNAPASESLAEDGERDPNAAPTLYQDLVAGSVNVTLLRGGDSDDHAALPATAC
jgi:hypothetical protein